MSVFNRASVSCSLCGGVTEGDVAASVNADRRPDLRDAILDGVFQRVPCASCSVVLRLPPRMTYMDVGRGDWLLAYPAAEIAQWRVLEAVAQEVFARGFGQTAPRPAQVLGRRLRPRLAFGWAALREKLLCRALDLDDATLELLKLLVLRTVPEPPLSDDTELRLDGADDHTLVLTWTVTRTEAALASVRVPLSAYEGILADPEGWAELRATCSSGMFVDMARLFVA